MAKFLDIDDLYAVVTDILAVTVLIDERVKDRELIEFTHAAMTHNHHLRPGKIVSRKMLNDWFHARKGVLRDALAKDQDDSFKKALLANITDKDLQRRLLTSIFSISICDYELRDEESNFIRNALAVWKTEMPNIADLDHVA